MATTPNSHTNLSPRRRSQRVLMQLAVRIRGTDAQGRKFEEDASTLAINAHGALVLLQARLTKGSSVQMQHKQTHEEQECRVAFLGPARAGQREIGLEFSEPRPTFWRVTFPPEDWSPRHPEARTLIPTAYPKK